MVLATVRAGGASGIGWTYGPAACAAVITDMLAGIVRGRSVLDVSSAFEAMVRAVRNAAVPVPWAMPSPRWTSPCGT